MNSLRNHSGNDVAKQIRKWLNFEWERLGNGKINGSTSPFEKHMVLKSPRSKLRTMLKHVPCPTELLNSPRHLPSQSHTKIMMLVSLFADICVQPVYHEAPKIYVSTMTSQIGSRL